MNYNTSYSYDCHKCKICRKCLLCHLCYNSDNNLGCSACINNNNIYLNNGCYVSAQPQYKYKIKKVNNINNSKCVGNRCNKKKYTTKNNNSSHKDKLLEKLKKNNENFYYNPYDYYGTMANYKKNREKNYNYHEKLKKNKKDSGEKILNRFNYTPNHLNNTTNNSQNEKNKSSLHKIETKNVFACIPKKRDENEKKNKKIFVHYNQNKVVDYEIISKNSTNYKNSIDNKKLSAGCNIKKTKKYNKQTENYHHGESFPIFPIIQEPEFGSPLDHEIKRKLNSRLNKNNPCTTNEKQIYDDIKYGKCYKKRTSTFYPSDPNKKPEIFEEKIVQNYSKSRINLNHLNKNKNIDYLNPTKNKLDKQIICGKIDKNNFGDVFNETILKNEINGIHNMINNLSYIDDEQEYKIDELKYKHIEFDKCQQKLKIEHNNLKEKQNDLETYQNLLKNNQDIMELYQNRLKDKHNELESKQGDLEQNQNMLNYHQNKLEQDQKKLKTNQNRLKDNQNMLEFNHNELQKKIDDNSLFENIIITNPKIKNIIDSYDNSIVEFDGSEGANCCLQISNNKYFNSPSIEPLGELDNIDLRLKSKGAGNLIFNGIRWVNSDGKKNQVLVTDGRGKLRFSTVDILNEETITTHDSLPSSIVQIPTINDHGYFFDGTFLAIASDDDSTVGYFEIKLLLKNINDNLILISDDKLAMCEKIHWDVLFNILNRHLIIKVKGDTTTTINWKLSYKMKSVY